MKKFLLGTVGLVALGMASAPASAADLAARPVYKAPPMIAPIYDWSGFYIGVNGGWGSSHNCWDATTAAGTFIAAAGRIPLGRRRRHLLFYRSEGRYVRDLHGTDAVRARANSTGAEDTDL